MSSVLLIAPTIDATDVGEAWVAYQWAAGISQRHQATILTYAKRGAPRASEQLPEARVIEWDEPPLLGRAERLNSLMKPGYMPFFLRAHAWAKAARRRGERFDVAHQVVPVAMRYPTPLLGTGLPYVLGPVGGGLTSPPAFVPEEGSAPWYTSLRHVDQWRLRHDRLLRRSYEEAECVLAIAPYVADALHGLKIRRLEIMGETGVTELPDRVPRPGQEPPTRVRLLHVGRLVRTKGARDVIRSLGMLRDIDLALDIVGDGPDRSECERLVREMNLEDRVSFHGRVPRTAVEVFYEQADVFVFPSYREPGGNVQFEAMAHGLPLIVGDRGGPSAAVDDTCAILITPRDPLSYAADIAAAVRRLATEPELRRQMGEASLRRVAEVGLWRSKFDRVSQLYDDIAGR